MELLPLTPGLLASAMIRTDHAVLMPNVDMGLPIVVEPAETRIPKAMDEVITLYGAATRGEPTPASVMEEFRGKGFYHPKRERSYTDALSEFEGMLDMAKGKIAKRLKE